MQNIMQNMEKILVLLREKVPLAVKRSAVKHAAVWKSSCSAESTSSCSAVQWMNWQMQERLGHWQPSKAVTAGRKKGSRPIPGKQVSTQSLVTNTLFSKHSSLLSPFHLKQIFNLVPRNHQPTFSLF